MKTCASAGVAIIHTSGSHTNIHLKRCVAAGFEVTNKWAISLPDGKTKAQIRYSSQSTKVICL